MAKNSKEKKRKKKNKEKLTIFPRHMRIFSIWKVKKKGRKIAHTKFQLISSTDGRTDRHTYFNSLHLTSAEKKSTSIGIAVRAIRLWGSIWFAKNGNFLDLLESKTTIQFAFSVCVCYNQVGNLRTDCAFSQLESERMRNSGMSRVVNLGTTTKLC